MSEVSGKKIFVGSDGQTHSPAVKTITMTDFRAEPGEFIRSVYRRGKSFLLTKAGKPVARLVPADSSLIFLVLCKPCRDRMLTPNMSPHLGDGWMGLPKLCPECEAKVAQCTRILVTGGAIEPNPETRGRS